MADEFSRSGVRYVDKDLLSFVDTTHASHNQSLARAFLSPEAVGIPAIMVGMSEGKLLTILMQLIGAKKVVEVGTLAGYSAIRLAQGLPKDGMVWTLEYDEQHAQIAAQNIQASAQSKKIRLLQGAALQVLPTIDQEGPFDVVFLDADKENYDKYARWALDHLRPGGVLLGDNAYFFGQLLEDSTAAAAMRRFHEIVAQECDSVCVPTPDGLVLGIKK